MQIIIAMEKPTFFLQKEKSIFTKLYISWIPMLKCKRYFVLFL